MGPSEPERDHVERPEWLWPQPFNNFSAYALGMDANEVANCWWRAQASSNLSLPLYDVHSAALRGNDVALNAMQLFRIELLTLRLKT